MADYEAISGVSVTSFSQPLRARISEPATMRSYRSPQPSPSRRHLPHRLRPSPNLNPSSAPLPVPSPHHSASSPTHPPRFLPIPPPLPRQAGRTLMPVTRLLISPDR